jgi:YVTN family beta-propeller protein
MKSRFLGPLLASTVLFVAGATAQHAQVSSLAVDPANPDRIWVCNLDNGTVSVIDVRHGGLVAEIPVGVHPRSLAFSADGSRVFVANQRGTVALDVNFVTGFTGTELRGLLSVISTASLSVTTTLTNVGVEPYGVAVAPNGKYFAVTGFRSATVKLYDASSLSQVAALQYLRNVNDIPPPFTIADVDSNRDGIADLDQPRGFVIRSDSRRLYVTHGKSPFVSCLDVTLDANGVPTGLALSGKIKIDDYAYDPVFNPVPVQVIQSQGRPRFLEDIALSPDGSRALVPHVLHNIDHDVNFNFGSALPGNFANRVYPALTLVDTVLNSFGAPGDASGRLHHELADPAHPAEYVPFGRAARTSAGDILTLGGVGSPVLGGSATFVVDGMEVGDTGVVLVGDAVTAGSGSSSAGALVRPRFTLPLVGNTASLAIPNSSSYDGYVGSAQALITHASGQKSYSTGLKFVVGAQGFGAGKLGYRCGQPSRVLFSPAGDHALLLNRGSEDVFLFKVAGSALELQCVFPPRHDFIPRAPLDTTTPMGDMPTGMALVPDLSTPNDDDALLYVMNEATRTLSVLRVDWAAGTIHPFRAQIPTHRGPDAFTLSQRRGEELFEDASRPQTSGNFNNSCGSCHFEGGDDGNVWQRPVGPRATMPLYGGTLATGLILWKGVRLNLGETGPMFAGENGGTGVLSDAEQQGLVDYHEKLAIPLNPNLDPMTGHYSPTAAFGRDLFFGTNRTGLNPSLRTAGCSICHPDVETNSGSFPGPRFYTADFVNPGLTSGENLATLDPSCFSLRENIVALNLRNVNTGADVDADGDGLPDADRNADGYNDLETYAIMNVDGQSDFERDDPNSYDCPCDPAVDPNCDPATHLRIFTRSALAFSIPTKLGVFASGPYFHDGVAYSLRALVDPDTQALDPVYGSPAFPGLTPYPGLNKIFNDVHDCRGHEQFVAGASKVQQTLQSTPATIDGDIAAILAYIQAL